MRSKYAVLVISLAATLVPTAAQAEKQSLTATVGATKFEGDDDTITYLMPTKSTLNLIAKTKGAAAYPPPKTPVDSLSIVCKNFAGKPVKFEAKDFGGHGCEATFQKGVSPKPFGDPQAEYHVVAGGKNSIEITSVKGKVVEGRFTLELVEKSKKEKLVITDGVFKVEDRQL